MEFPPNVLSAGLEKAAKVASYYLRDASDVRDVVLEVSLSLVRAQENGILVTCVEGFMVRAARLEALSLLRMRQRRRSREGKHGEEAADPADVAITGEVLLDEVLLDRLLVRLRQQLNRTMPAVDLR